MNGVAVPNQGQEGLLVRHVAVGSALFSVKRGVDSQFSELILCGGNRCDFHEVNPCAFQYKSNK